MEMLSYRCCDGVATGSEEEGCCIVHDAISWQKVVAGMEKGCIFAAWRVHKGVLLCCTSTEC